MFQQQTDEVKQCHQTELEASHSKLLQTELTLKGNSISHYQLLFYSHISLHCLQCFDTVGWASVKKACKTLSGEVLLWLSVWSKVQMICIPSR